MEKHLVDYGRHLVFKVWKGGIDLRHLLDDVLPSEVPLVGLEDSLEIPSMLIDAGMTITEEV